MTQFRYDVTCIRSTGHVSVFSYATPGAAIRAANRFVRLAMFRTVSVQAVEVPTSV